MHYILGLEWDPDCVESIEAPYALLRNVPRVVATSWAGPIPDPYANHYCYAFSCSSCTFTHIMTDPAPSTPRVQADPSRKYTSFSSILKSPERQAPRSTHDSPTGWHLPSVDENGPSQGSRSRSRSQSRSRVKDVKGNKAKDSGALSLWRMMALTVSMGGSQVRACDMTWLTRRLPGLCKLASLAPSDRQGAGLWDSISPLSRTLGAAHIPCLAGWTHLRSDCPAADWGGVRLVNFQVPA